MTTQELKLRHAIHDLVMGVWFRNWQKKNEYPLSKELPHYQRLVENWRSTRWWGFFLIGIFALSATGFCFRFTYGVPSSPELAWFRVICLLASLVCLVVGIHNLWDARGSAPDLKARKLVDESRAAERALALQLWNTYVMTNRTHTQLDKLISETRELEASQVLEVPTDLIRAAQGKLKAIGVRVSRLNSEYKGAQAMSLKNREFIPAYNAAKLLGLIDDEDQKMGYSLYIPPPTF